MGWFAGLRPVVVLGALGWVVRDGALQDAEAGAQAWRDRRGALRSVRISFLASISSR